LGSRGVSGTLIEDTSLEVDDASLQHPGLSLEPSSFTISEQDAMTDSEGLRSQAIGGVSHMDGQLSTTFQFVSGSVVLEDKTNPRYKQRYVSISGSSDYILTSSGRRSQTQASNASTQGALIVAHSTGSTIFNAT
jgi:hypothetical protein